MIGKVFHNVKEPIYLCCDSCEESFVEKSKMPVLRRIKQGASRIVNSNIHNVIWLHVMRPTINSVRLYISNGKGEITSLGPEELNCTLLFIPKEKRVLIQKNGKIIFKIWLKVMFHWNKCM